MKPAEGGFFSTRHSLSDVGRVQREPALRLLATDRSVSIIGIAGVMVGVTRPGHTIAAVTVSIPGHFMAGTKRAPIESAVHDISVADGRVGHDVGAVRAGVMPGTMMMYALRI